MSGHRNGGHKKKPGKKKEPALQPSADTDDAEAVETEVDSEERGKEPSVRWFKEPKTDVAMMWFTFIAALAAVASGWIFYLQLHEMQRTMLLDQRAWMKVKVNGQQSVLIKNQPVTMPIQITNIGKTVARQVFIDGVVEIVQNGHSPAFNYNVNHQVVVEGSMYPGEPRDTVVPMGGAGMSGASLLSEADADRLQSGKVYIATYVSVKYQDIFGIQHWTHFCMWSASDHAKTAVSTPLDCSAYNGTDDN